MQPASVDRSSRWNTRALVLLVALALLTLALLGVPSVERTQEARVLETARDRARAHAIDTADELVVVPLGGGVLLDVFLTEQGPLAAILSLDGEPLAALPVIRGA